MTKKTKSEVNYREAMGSQHCGNCSMFKLLRGQLGDCSLVEGRIYTFDVCDEWKPEE